MLRRSHRVDNGQWAEAKVRRLLEQQGWRCEACRWQCRYGELDLVLSKGEGSQRCLLVVEVKSRRRRGLDGWGAASVTRAKRQKLAKAMACWQAEQPWQAACFVRVVVALVPLPPCQDDVTWIAIDELPDQCRD